MPKIPGGYRRYSVAVASTAFANSAAPQYVSGAGINMEKVQQGTLSALATVKAETNTITIVGYWQVSKDNSTYYNVAGTANNAANVAIATGTSGADAAVTVCIPAPDAVYAFPYARIRFATGVATADGTNDVAGADYAYLTAGSYNV